MEVLEEVESSIADTIEAEMESKCHYGSLSQYSLDEVASLPPWVSRV